MAETLKRDYLDGGGQKEWSRKGDPAGEVGTKDRSKTIESRLYYGTEGRKKTGEGQLICMLYENNFQVCQRSTKGETGKDGGYDS